MSLGKPERYKKTIQNNTGKLICDVVLQTLTRQERKQGTTGSRYTAEKDHYEEAMNSVFINLLVRGFALWKKGISDDFGYFCFSLQIN